MYNKNSYIKCSNIYKKQHSNITEISKRSVSIELALRATRKFWTAPPSSKRNLTNHKMMQTDAESKETKKKKERNKEQLKGTSLEHRPNKKNRYLETVGASVADTKEIISRVIRFDITKRICIVFVKERNKKKKDNSSIR